MSRLLPTSKQKVIFKPVEESDVGEVACQHFGPVSKNISQKNKSRIQDCVGSDFLQLELPLYSEIQ